MRKLDRLLLLERLKEVMPIALFVLGLLVFLGFAFWHSKKTDEIQRAEVFGELMHHSQDQADEGSFFSLLRIRLENGEEITIRAYKPNLPEIGETVKLVKTQYPSGKVQYIYSITQ